MQKKIIYLLFSLLLSIEILLSYNIGNIDNYPENFINNFHFNSTFFIKAIILTIPIYLLLKIALLLINQIRINKTSINNNKSFLLLVFISLTITNLIFLITYFPGSNMNDTLYIINNPIAYSTQHPIFYNLILSIPFKIFYKITSNINISFFIISFIQILFMNAIITYIIYWINKSIHNKILTILTFLYFLLLPIVSNYNSVLIKDSLFSGLLLLHIPIIYNIINNNKSNNKYIFIILLLTVLIRNNGLYIVIFEAIVLSLYTKKNFFIKSLVLIIIINSIPNLILNNKQLFQEKIAIPIQQISYVTKYKENTIANKDKQYLNKIMKINDIKNYYNPYNVDTIKWNSNFNRQYLDKTKKDFLILWVKLLKNNKEEYIKSYLLETYHLWSINEFKTTQSRFLGIDKSDYNETTFNMLENKRVFPKSIHNKLKTYYEKTTIFFNNGTCIWILLFLLTIIINKKKYKYILLFLPFIGLYLTLLISAPISYAFRYMSPILYSLPILIIVTLKINKKSI